MSIIISPLIPGFMIIRILANYIVIFWLLILEFLIKIKKIHLSMIPRIRSIGVLNGAIQF